MLFLEGGVINEFKKYIDDELNKKIKSKGCLKKHFYRSQSLKKFFERLLILYFICLIPFVLYYDALFELITNSLNNMFLTFLILYCIMVIIPVFLIGLINYNNIISLEEKYWVEEIYENFKKKHRKLKDKKIEKNFLLSLKKELEIKLNSTLGNSIEYFLDSLKNPASNISYLYDILVGPGFLLLFIYMIINNQKELALIFLYSSPCLLLIMIASRVIYIIFLLLKLKERESKLKLEGIDNLLKNL